MANTKNTTKKETVKKVNTKKAVTKKETIAKDDIKPIETKKEISEKKDKKKTVLVKQLNNSEMKELFISNGCQTYSKSNDSSNVVYNTFGTKSRILQQGRGYQLLLTNGHKMINNEIVDTDNDDTKRFMDWYGTLSDEKKMYVSGAENIMSTKLSSSELPRERVAKITNLDLLVEFIKYMGTFAENKVLA